MHIWSIFLPENIRAGDAGKCLFKRKGGKKPPFKHSKHNYVHKTNIVYEMCITLSSRFLNFFKFTNKLAWSTSEKFSFGFTIVVSNELNCVIIFYNNIVQIIFPTFATT